MKFKQNIERDAALVKAAMGNVVVPLAIGLGWTPNDLNDHGKWLKRQPQSYLDKVIKRVIELEESSESSKTGEPVQKGGHDDQN